MSVMYLAGDKGLLEPDMFHNLVDFTRMWDFTWRVSDCEELVGDKSVNRFMTNYFTQKFHSVFLIDNKFGHC